jgi:hypothetical protein
VPALGRLKACLASCDQGDASPTAAVQPRGGPAGVTEVSYLGFVYGTEVALA